jgi:hypothetical protein
VLDLQTNQPRSIPVCTEDANAIAVEFRREWPRIAAAAAAGFPVPDAIPFELRDETAGAVRRHLGKGTGDACLTLSQSDRTCRVAFQCVVSGKPDGLPGFTWRSMNS